MKHAKLFWGLVIFNFLVNIVVVTLLLLPYIIPEHPGAKGLRLWVGEQNNKTIQTVIEENEQLKDWVDKENQRVIDYVNSH